MTEKGPGGPARGAARKETVLRWTLLLGVLACLGCGSGGGDGSPSAVLEPAALGEEIDLALGNRITIPQADLRITFQDVSDSRCPIDVTCIGEGDGIASLVVEEISGSGEAALSLHTYPSYAHEGTFGNCRIELLRLEPYPVESHPTEDYVVTLLVEHTS